MRAAVSMLRSPTSTTCCKPNRSRIFATWLATVIESAVEPSKTSTATGQPSAVHSRPKTICNVPFLPSPTQGKIKRYHRSMKNVVQLEKY